VRQIRTIPRIASLGAALLAGVACWAISSPGAAYASTRHAPADKAQISHEAKVKPSPLTVHTLPIAPSVALDIHPDSYTNGCTTSQNKTFHLWSSGNWNSGDGGNYCVGGLGITDLPDNDTTYWCSGNNTGYFAYVYDGTDYQEDFSPSSKADYFSNRLNIRILHVNITGSSGSTACPFSH
jgi:hypothetical protein